LVFKGLDILGAMQAQLMITFEDYVLLAGLVTVQTYGWVVHLMVMVVMYVRD
jgi:hypothetical protein